MNVLNLKAAALIAAAPALAFAAPAIAAPSAPQAATHSITSHAPVPNETIAEHKRGHRDRWSRGRGNSQRYDRNYNRGYDSRDRDYGQPIRRDTRIWRGRDGQYYCRKDNGTTGLLIGAAVGGLIGNEVAGRGDRTLGAILGAAGGAILGRTIDRSNSRCR